MDPESLGASHFWYTEPFSTVPGLFESGERGLSNHPSVVEKGSVYQKCDAPKDSGSTDYFGPYVYIIKGAKPVNIDHKPVNDARPCHTETRR